jgi:hypothetical protein
VLIHKRLQNDASLSEDDSDDEQSDISLPEYESEEEEEPEEPVITTKSTTSKRKPKAEIIKMGDVDIEWSNGSGESTEDLRMFKPAHNMSSNLDLFKYRGIIDEAVLQFFWILPISFFKQVVINTNDYATMARAAAWIPLVLYELLIFLAILLIYSVPQTPRIRDLWKQDDLFVCPLIRKTGMTYKCWSQIRKFLHIAPIVQPENSKGDKYFKVRAMIDVLVLNSKSKHPYSRHYSLDEMTIGYQGRTYLIKRTPSKKVPKGFQCLALSSDNGYVLDIHFDLDEFPMNYPGISPTGNRVMKLCAYLKSTNKWDIVYMDNRFTTPLLF